MNDKDIYNCNEVAVDDETVYDCNEIVVYDYNPLVNIRY